MPKPLMPKATVVWLVDNTTLTFEQIADFCDLHHLEVQGIADGEVAIGITGVSPIKTGELTVEEIDRCQKDPSGRMKMSQPDLPVPVARTKGPRYTPLSKRQDRPDAISWLVTQHPELSDAQISRLVGTTKPTINAIRERTHWNAKNLKPQSPVKLGLCTQVELMTDIEKATRAAERREARATAKKKVPAKAEAKAEANTPVPETTPETAADLPDASPDVSPDASNEENG